MGNNVSGILRPAGRLAAMKFDTDEMHVLRKTWQDLADRNNGKGIDKDTFLQYFPLNGLLGERLFAQFDTKGSGQIDFEDFIRGLAIVCRGTLDEKTHFVFNMYDVSHDNTVSKQDLTTLLNHIPKYALGQGDLGYPHSGALSPVPMGDGSLGQPDLHRSYSIDSFNGSVNYASSNVPAPQLQQQQQQQQLTPQGIAAADADAADAAGHSAVGEDPLSACYNGNHANDPSYEEDVDDYTNHDMVERAFAECDLNHEGRLTYPEFKMWVERTPSVLQYIESILPYYGPKDVTPHHDKRESLPHMKRIASRASAGNIPKQLGENSRSNSLRDLAGDIFNHSTNPHSHSAHTHATHATADRPHSATGLAGRRASRSNSLQQLSLMNFSASKADGSSNYNYNNGGTGGAQSPSLAGPGYFSSDIGSSGMPSPVSRTSSFGRQPSYSSAAHTPSSSGAAAAAAAGMHGFGSAAGIAADSNTTLPVDISTIPAGGNGTAAVSAVPTVAGDGGNGMKTNGSDMDLHATHLEQQQQQQQQQHLWNSVVGGNHLVRSPSIGGGMDSGGSVYAQSNMDPEEATRMYLLCALESTSNEALRAGINQLLEQHTSGGGVIMAPPNESDIYKTVVTMESYLWKKGKSLFHMLSRRYYLLSGNCMYYYTHKNDVRPKGVIFLTGSIVERVTESSSDGMALKGYFGFEIMHQDLCTGEHHRHEKRVLYCKSEAECEKWVSALQHAAHVVPIEDDYVIGKELGRGRFSVVCECVHKVTGVHCAVKIIDKATIEPEEKSLLRTEIAVLKLVNHPNIIRMEGLYESKQNIYIVMEMLKGGELFERIVGRPRFTEVEAAKLIRPLLESVAYLHDLGIVHRDLKPENILCGEELEDLKIADFGLSKMVLPKEKMDSACGTLSYVAPEVLTMQGYGKEADLWSVGVIMFLLMCGKLPFDGEDHNEIIRSTIQADLKVNPAVWSKLSDDAKGLMTALLNKAPKERITARDALRHPFILHYGPNPRRSQSMYQQQPSQHPAHPPLPPSHHPHTLTPTAAAAAAAAGKHTEEPETLQLQLQREPQEEEQQQPEPQTPNSQEDDLSSSR